MSIGSTTCSGPRKAVSACTSSQAELRPGSGEGSPPPGEVDREPVGVPIAPSLSCASASRASGFHAVSSRADMRSFKHRDCRWRGRPAVEAGQLNMCDFDINFTTGTKNVTVTNLPISVVYELAVSHPKRLANRTDTCGVPMVPLSGFANTSYWLVTLIAFP
jgi:hypothetical protein